ncbi:UvrD-helicase domain-containing protein [Photobacterium sp. TLY01]|uniref:UvrD-helicase domain-containing protein n=1 Tax=Photobacterium sp. TLY01 TaxID=2907534 RepID=UPI001F2882AB|nr:UvrD-helicase domain-containing protein [Photobacterium sp. TLY01]UIP30504.1 UvrD-helicase domain-containing protein [Photobacterium sp. TLY01]
MSTLLPNLKKFRNAQGFTQESLALASGVSRATIARVERGETCSARNMRRLANALNVEVDSIQADTTPVIKELKETPIAKAVGEQFNYSPAQQQAIDHTPSNLQILAGAGSGKTAVMSERSVSLISEHAISPENIAVLTFTEKAATEVAHRIRQRYRSKFGHEKRLDHMFVGTIHSYCLELRDTYLPEYLSFELLDGIGQYIFIQRHFSEICPNGLPKEEGGYYKMPVAMRLAPQIFNVLREAEIDKSQVQDSEVLECLARYQKKLHEMRKMDFSGLLLTIVEALEDNDAFRNAVREKLRYLIIDEYQDTNHLQERLIRNIVNLDPDNIHLSVVGDDDQSIYGWNNADTDNILTFHQRYKNVEKIELNHNYRSSRGVLTCAYALVGENAKRVEKDWKAASIHSYTDGDITALTFPNPQDESEWICRRIEDMIGCPYQDKPGKPERGLTYSDFVILVRTKAQAEPIVKALEQHGIRYEFKGGPGLITSSSVGQAAAGIFYYIHGHTYRRQDNKITKEVFGRKQLLEAWEKAALGLTKSDICRGIDRLDTFKAQFPQEGTRTGKDHSEWSLQRAFLAFLEAANIDQDKIPAAGNSMLRSYGEQVFSLLGQFSQLITQYEQHNFDSTPHRNYDYFCRFLFYAADGLFKEEQLPNNDINAVSVMTVHAAKGLEWPAVFIPGMVNGKFPLKPAGGANMFHILPRECVKNAEAFRTPEDEERRLAFVAMTRAEKYLHLSWSNTGKRGQNKPSLFFNEVQLVDCIITDKNYTEHLSLDKIRPEMRSSKGVLNIPFTDIVEYDVCPYRYFLKTVCGFDEAYRREMGYGQIMHNCLYDYHEMKKQGKEPTEADIIKAIDRHFHLPHTKKFEIKLREKMKQGIQKRLLHYHNSKGKYLKDIAHVEQSLNLMINDNLRITGRMDLLRYRDGKKEVIDIKSGQLSKNTTGDEQIEIQRKVQLQLAGYALAEEQNTGSKPDTISAIYLQPDNLSGDLSSREMVTDDMLKKTRSKLSAIGSDIQNGVRTKNCPPSACQHCIIGKALCPKAK